MPENNDRINDLLDQYVNKTITEEDFAELFNYISKEEYKPLLDDYMKKLDKVTSPDADVHHVDWNYMYQNIVVDKKERSKTAITEHRHTIQAERAVY